VVRWAALGPEAMSQAALGPKAVTLAALGPEVVGSAALGPEVVRLGDKYFRSEYGCGLRSIGGAVKREVIHATVVKLDVESSGSTEEPLNSLIFGMPSCGGSLHSAVLRK